MENYLPNRHISSRGNLPIWQNFKSGWQISGEIASVDFPEILLAVVADSDWSDKFSEAMGGARWRFR